MNEITPFEYEQTRTIAGCAVNIIVAELNILRHQQKIEARLAAIDPNAVKVGDIFRMSWGYDQTNVDTFQVVSLTPKGVYVREIASDTVEGSEGFMSSKVKPVKDKFLEHGMWTKDGNKPMFRRIDWSGGQPSFNIKGRYFARRVNADSATYCSWYA